MKSFFALLVIFTIFVFQTEEVLGMLLFLVRCEYVYDI